MHLVLEHQLLLFLYQFFCRTEQLEELNAILDSKLYYIWLYNKGKRKGELFELYQKPLSEIPIKKADEQTQNKFVSIVDKILVITQTDDYLQNSEKQNAVQEYERQIDVMVYKLYDLTYEEVKSIDKDFPLSEEEYLIADIKMGKYEPKRIL